MQSLNLRKMLTYIFVRYSFDSLNEVPRQFRQCALPEIKRIRTNAVLPIYFTSNIHEAYQRQINSHFLVTQPGIEPRTLD